MRSLPALIPLFTSLWFTNVRAQIPPQFELSWGQCCSGDGNFWNPSDVAISPNGTLYVIDVHRVQVFSADGSFLATWDAPSPSAIETDEQGNVYVATWDGIRKYSSSGVQLLAWGSHGNGPGQFAGILGLAIGPNGTIYAADFGNYRVAQFNPDSTLIRTWGSYGEEDGSFIAPSGVAVDQIGNVYVSDDRLSRIQKFTETGVHLATFNLPDAPDHYVEDVEVGAQSEIYVVEPGHDRVEVLDESGNVLFGWGIRGSGNGQFRFPMAIGLLPGYGLYVVDYGNNRIQKFSYPVPVRNISWGSLKAKY